MDKKIILSLKKDSPVGLKFQIKLISVSFLPSLWTRQNVAQAASTKIPKYTIVLSGFLPFK